MVYNHREYRSALLKYMLQPLSTPSRIVHEMAHHEPHKPIRTWTE